MKLDRIIAVRNSKTVYCEGEDVYKRQGSNGRDKI